MLLSFSSASTLAVLTFALCLQALSSTKLEQTVHGINPVIRLHGNDHAQSYFHVK